MRPAYSDTIGVLTPARRRRGLIVLADPRHGRRQAACRAARAEQHAGARGEACPAYLGATADGPVGVVTTFLPEFASDLAQLAQLAAAQGIQLGFNSYGGFRDQATTQLISKYRDQDYAAYLKQLLQTNPLATPLPIDQWRPLVPFGQSFHNFGAAADLNPIVWPPALGTRTDALNVLHQLAPLTGLRFPLPTSDPAHVELAEPLATVQTRWLLQGANASSRPDVLAVSLPAEIDAGMVPGVSFTSSLPGTVAPITAPPPDVGINYAPAPSSSPGMLVAIGAGMLLLGYAVARQLRAA